jgi:hypothetical protein
MKKGKNNASQDPSSENRKYGKEVEYGADNAYLEIRAPMTEFKNVPVGKSFLRTYQMTEAGARFGCFWTYLNDATMFKKISKSRAEKIVSHKAENIGKAVAMKPDEKVFVVPSLRVFHS